MALVSRKATRSREELMLTAEQGEGSEMADRSWVEAAVKTRHETGDPESGPADSESSDPDGGSSPTGSDDSDTSTSVEDDQATHSMKQELSTLSFEELQELQRKVGLKVYNQVAHGTGTGAKGEKRNRPNKNRPIEMSTKQPVPYLRKVIPVKKRLVRDPRFDDLSGEYKPDIYDNTYSFLNDVRNKEKQVILKKLKKAKNQNLREKLESLLQRMTQQDEAQNKRQQQRERLKEFKQKQRERVQQGHKPYYLKKSLLQNHARRHGFSVDSLIFEFHVQPFRKQNENFSNISKLKSSIWLQAFMWILTGPGFDLFCTDWWRIKKV
ncbi:ribosomal RNA processing protein 36 homolog [Carcharodon carcharias]|uniref:ribosomal RNA processing protein 36 homolog n=1 Tax=Carcharodon carcharias TaxID=13397 RepID=UPI001B7F6146|nr:ribosomal RNA processing protein 36 homolog [Carcharodon carcharias]